MLCSRNCRELELLRARLRPNCPPHQSKPCSEMGQICCWTGKLCRCECTVSCGLNNSCCCTSSILNLLVLKEQGKANSTGMSGDLGQEATTVVQPLKYYFSLISTVSWEIWGKTAFKFYQAEVRPELFLCKSGGTSLHLIMTVNIHVSPFFDEYPQTLLELYRQC